ncbi:uncharacterized protein LOC115594393 [Sparus aurata]|uniref:uncharacterized protein LOC115594393 n=1 Tax=Sparus aurata TaxID=8175 RepID=UPI0011C16DA4|nr:uncharacterized protein LOC115594393 [Sparus aurata]
MKTGKNSRGYDEYYWEGQHLKLTDLKEEAKDLENQYLLKENIPLYPRPELHVTHLKHDTKQYGLRGIRWKNGFKSPHKGSLVWWSLAVTPDDITSAERRLLETTYPDRTQEQVQMQQSFLKKFATSPSFSELSRLGSYRFTFPLEEVLEAYSQQCCSGYQPVMRVYKTVLYQKEVMYVILVHSPANQEQFSDRPLLTDDPNSVCSYKDGRFIWRPEAMCETHSYELVQRPDENQMEAGMVSSRHEYYVWDHVAVALHVGRQVLKFDPARLRRNLKYCEKAKPAIAKPWEFQDFQQAEELVRELWPDDSSPLERAEPLN